jgi:hypothetical protein
VKNYFNYYGILLDGYFPNSLELFYGTVNNNIKRIWRVYHRNKLDIYSDRACNSLGWGDYGQPNRDLASTGKGAANRHKINNFQFFKSNLKYYDKFISWSRKNKVVLILYTPPAHKYYIDEFDKCTFEIIASIGKSLKNTNVFYYNFINDSSFLDNDFYDANHLNDRGAKKFSKIIDSIIKKSFQ